MDKGEKKEMTGPKTSILNPIRNEEDHLLAINRIEDLIDLEASRNTPEGDELEIVSLLVENYESRVYNILPPDPIDAILFRMDQLGLARKDLEAYLGGRSRVSEILSRKKPLSLSMIKSLYTNLGIPADILLSDPHIDTNDDIIDIYQFPVDEIRKLGWLDSFDGETKDIMLDYINPVMDMNATLAHYRRKINYRSGRVPNEYSLIAWTARIWHLAEIRRPDKSFKPKEISVEAARRIVRLSTYPDGPLRAIDALRSLGVIVIVEKHLRKTYLDGSLILKRDKNPIIGMTIRYDRIDYFWFTLMHEIAHLILHPNAGITQFFDDLETRITHNKLEHEADTFAREVLIPDDEFEISPAKHLHTPEAAEHLARKLNIHPAIVAGRMRYEAGSFRILGNMVGNGEIRRLFPEANWN